MAEKEINHLRANTMVKDKTLLVTRVFIWLVISVLFSVYAAFVEFTWAARFFTIWGLTLTTVYFNLILLAYCLEIKRVHLALSRV